MANSTWQTRHRRGSAEALHAIDPPDADGHWMWVNEVERPALVLGSSQSLSTSEADRAGAAGLEIVHRRSGGGAVLLVPHEYVWIDLWVPRSSPLWDDDVIAAVDWVGSVWIAALDGLLDASMTAHHGPLQVSPWSARVCFAGIGPGEVLAGERKLVGVSQRRSRDWARFQCVVHRVWDAPRTFAAFAGDTDIDDAVIDGWSNRVATVGEHTDIVGLLAAALPSTAQPSTAQPSTRLHL